MAGVAAADPTGGLRRCRRRREEGLSLCCGRVCGGGPDLIGGAEAVPQGDGRSFRVAAAGGGGAAAVPPWDGRRWADH